MWETLQDSERGERVSGCLSGVSAVPYHTVVDRREIVGPAINTTDNALA